MAISPYSNASAEDDTVAMPAHLPGHMIVAAAARNGDVTPSLPSGAGWINLFSGTMFRCAYKVAASASEVMGTWSNAHGVSVAVYAKDDGDQWVTPTVSDAAASSSTIGFPGLAAVAGLCWFVRPFGHRSATNLLTNTPAGWVSRAGSARYTRILDTGGPVTGPAEDVGGNAQSVNATNWWRALTITLAVLEGVSGGVAASTGKASIGASGQHGQSGVLASQVSRVTAAAAGAQGQAGVLAASIGKAVAAVVAAQQLTASIAAMAPRVQAALDGIARQSGQLVAATLPPALSGAAAQTVAATVAATVRQAGILVDASYTQADIAIAAATRAVTAAMNARQTVPAVLAAATRPASAAIAAAHPFIGAIATAVRPPAAAAAANHSQQGALTTRARDAQANVVASQRLAGTVSASARKASAAASATLVPGGAITGQVRKPMFEAKPRFEVFSPATVLTLSGLNFNIYNDQPTKFGGMFNRPPYTMVKINYPASLSKNSISKGVSEFNNTVRRIPGKKIALCQSQGCQAAKEWIDTYRNDPTAPGADELMFIFTGNPLRATGGDMIGMTMVNGQIGTPTPTDSQWTIIDFARRYDGWPDPPQDKNNLWAMRNAKSGKNSYHLGYDVADLYAPSNLVWKIGTTYFVLSQEEPPILKKMGNVNPALRAAVKREIEAGYTNRPAGNVPTPLVAATDWFWKNVIKLLNLPEVPDA